MFFHIKQGWLAKKSVEIQRQNNIAKIYYLLYYYIIYIIYIITILVIFFYLIEHLVWFVYRYKRSLSGVEADTN